uniref:Uncharacterized protein n=1 Tax=Oryza meridionalis TaxID=40149 RepID=A0A0E0F765_9ORYZ
MRLRSTGRLRLMPSTLALTAVQRQTAASRSARPESSGQQSSGPAPILTPTSPLSTLAHTLSFRASIGQRPWRWYDGVVGVGITGPPEQLGSQPCAATARMRRLMARRGATLVEAIANAKRWSDRASLIS